MLDRDCTRYQITILAAGCLFLAQSIVYPNKVRKVSEIINHFFYQPITIIFYKYISCITWFGWQIRGLWECDSLLLKEAVSILRDLYLKKRLPHCHEIRSRYTNRKVTKFLVLKYCFNLIEFFSKTLTFIQWGGVANFPCPDTILEVVDFWAWGDSKSHIDISSCKTWDHLV